MFAKETYIRRRQQLKDTLKSGLLRSSATMSVA